MQARYNLQQIWLLHRHSWWYDHMGKQGWWKWTWQTSHQIFVGHKTTLPQNELWKNSSSKPNKKVSSGPPSHIMVTSQGMKNCKPLTYCLNPPMWEIYNILWACLINWKSTVPNWHGLVTTLESSPQKLHPLYWVLNILTHFMPSRWDYQCTHTQVFWP